MTVVCLLGIEDMEATQLSSKGNQTVMPRKDQSSNRFNAYNLVSPISNIYSTECENVLKNLREFCEDFEATYIVAVTMEYYNTKQMCNQFKVGAFTVLIGQINGT